MTSRFRSSYTASEILTMVQESANAFRQLTPNEILKNAQGAYTKLTQPASSVEATGPKQTPDYIPMALETERDALLINSAALILTAQDGRSDALLDFVSSAFGTEWYPQLVTLGKTGVLPPEPPAP